MPDNLQSQLSRTLGAAYTIDRELGGGGMSRVYVAEDTRLKRKVVVKVLSPELAAGVSAERFEREIQLAAALQQANIVPVLSAGDTDGLPYYTMPFIDGLSLRARLERNGAMPVAEAVGVLRDVTRALAYAHEHGVVHRDIKPENILLSGDAAVVTDFGIAKALSASRTKAPGGTLTQVGTSMGTPAYMAPEQAAGDPDIDQRADIYALGCVAYEMLTGAPPFHDRPLHQIFAAHMTEAPVSLAQKRSDAPRELARLIMRCLEKDPGKRPQSAREVLQILDTASSGEFRSGSVSRRHMMGVVVASAVVVIAASAIVMRARGAATERSIAVLPFTTAGGDSTQAYFAEGVADELTTVLARLPGLRVASRSAAFATARRLQTAQEVGRALNVTTVLEGTVRRAGAKIRITAQLTNVADGIAVWSDKFDRDTGDVFTAQDELSRRIADALHDKLAVTQAGTVSTARGTKDQDAYDLYLRGRYFWQRRGEAGLRKAAELFTNAITRDPDFARAWGGLAMVQVVLPEYQEHPEDSLYTVGLRNAAHAIRLDSTAIDGQLALAYGQIARWELDSSEAGFRRVLAIAPNDPTVHQWYGDLLVARGRPREGYDEMRKALALDPTNAVLTNELAYFEFVQLHFRQSVEWAHRTVELDSTFGLIYFNEAASFAYLRQADSVEFYIKKAREAGTAATPIARALTAVAWSVVGRADEARTLAAALADDAGKSRVHAYMTALAYAGLSDTTKSLEWLTKSVDAHETDPIVQSVVCAPPFDFVKDNARYKALLARMHLTVCARG